MKPSPRTYYELLHSFAVSGRADQVRTPPPRAPRALAGPLLCIPPQGTSHHPFVWSSIFLLSPSHVWRTAECRRGTRNIWTVTFVVILCDSI